jgi:hypothetical protein
MMHFFEIALALVASVFAIFVVSVFHAAAVEVSRKPRLAIVTQERPTAVMVEAETLELAVAA